MNRPNRTLPARFDRRLAAVALIALSLGGCGGETQASGSRSSQTPMAVTIEDGKVTPVARSVDVKVGDSITLRITSDRAAELHVHATPEQHLDVTKGRSTVEMTFDKPGTVDVEEHATGALVLRMLVR